MNFPPFGPFPHGRIKEADKVTLPQELPRAPEFRTWKNKVRMAVSAASGREDDSAFLWIQAVEHPEARLEHFAHSGEFPQLDRKLGIALFSVARGEVLRQLQRLSETEARAGRLLKGRQCLHVIYEQYKMDEEAGSLYNMTDIMSVQLRSDAYLEDFLSNWQDVLAGMDQEPPIQILEHLFLNNLRHSQVLREEVLHYERCPVGHPHRTYAYLMGAARRYLMRKKHESNRRAVLKALTSSHGAAPAMPAGPPSAARRSPGGHRPPSRSASPRSTSSSRPGVCFQFQREGTCARGASCPYKHERGSRSPSQSRGSGKGKGSRHSSRGSRSSTPGSRKGKGRRPSNERRPGPPSAAPASASSSGSVVCLFGTTGHCKLGATCPSP